MSIATIAIATLTVIVIALTLAHLHTDVACLRADIARLHADVKGALGADAGSGTTTFTYTLTNRDETQTPIAQAKVWVTTDPAGANIIASLYTDALGKAVFYLDPGVVYIWQKKPGWTFDNPSKETIA